MLKKTEIISLCKEVAKDYEGWDFVAGIFKNKKINHTVKMVHPLWSFSPGSALAQPIAAVCNKKVDKIYKEIIGFSGTWTHNTRFERGVDDYIRRFRIYDIIEDDAEGRIRQLMDRGIEVIESTYDFSSEEALLKSIPVNIEKDPGLINCIIQGEFGNFDFIEQYCTEKIETIYPKRLDDAKKIADYYGVKL